MDKKETIAIEWLNRYTGTEPKDYGEWILLTNFQNYVEKHESEFDDTMGDELKKFVNNLPYVYRKDLELPPKIMGTYNITTFVPQNRELPDEGEPTLKVVSNSHLWSTD